MFVRFFVRTLCVCRVFRLAASIRAREIFCTPFPGATMSSVAKVVWWCPGYGGSYVSNGIQCAFLDFYGHLHALPAVEQKQQHSSPSKEVCLVSRREVLIQAAARRRRRQDRPPPPPLQQVLPKKRNKRVQKHKKTCSSSSSSSSSNNSNSSSSNSSSQEEVEESSSIKSSRSSASSSSVDAAEMDSRKEESPQTESGQSIAEARLRQLKGPLRDAFSQKKTVCQRPLDSEEVLVKTGAK